MELAATPTDHLRSPFGGQLSITFLEVKEDNGDLMTKDRRRAANVAKSRYDRR